jgi:hypothetical protein
MYQSPLQKLVNEFLASYEIRWLITVFTRSRKPVLIPRHVNPTHPNTVSARNTLIISFFHGIPNNYFLYTDS